MDKKPVVLYKTLVIGVIILFLGVAVQPSVATIQPEEEINAEPYDYLFQIIIDLVNNPDVKKLFEQYENDLLKVDIDRSVYRKILFRNPRLFRSLIFTKPSLTYEYLDKSYNYGIEITNILGEDKALEIIESIELTNPEVLDELKNIIINDENLSGRNAMLKEMNMEITHVTPLEDNLVVCITLGLIVITCVIAGVFFLALAGLLPENLYEIFLLVYGVFIAIAFGCYGLMAYIGCFDFLP